MSTWFPRMSARFALSALGPLVRIICPTMMHCDIMDWNHHSKLFTKSRSKHVVIRILRVALIGIILGVLLNACLYFFTSLVFNIGVSEHFDVKLASIDSARIENLRNQLSKIEVRSSEFILHYIVKNCGLNLILIGCGFSCVLEYVCMLLSRRFKQPGVNDQKALVEVPKSGA
jgi:hypothetical protein